MSRTAVFIVVLALAGSPDAAVLCQALCAPQADVSQACDHDAASLVQIAAGGDCCDDMAAGPGSAQVPAVGRTTSLRDGVIAIPVLRDTLVGPEIAAHRGYEPGRRQPPTHPPLTTILRI